MRLKTVNISRNTYPLCAVLFGEGPPRKYTKVNMSKQFTDAIGDARQLKGDNWLIILLACLVVGTRHKADHARNFLSRRMENQAGVFAGDLLQDVPLFSPLTKFLPLAGAGKCMKTAKVS